MPKSIELPEMDTGEIMFDSSQLATIAVRAIKKEQRLSALRSFFCFWRVRKGRYPKTRRGPNIMHGRRILLARDEARYYIRERVKERGTLWMDYYFVMQQRMRK